LKPIFSRCRYGFATLTLTLMLTVGVAALRSEVAAPPAPAGTVVIPAGTYAPLIRSKDEPERSPVAAYYLDERPVTNAEFLAFVRALPQWQRSRVSPLFADVGYLAHWAGDTALGALGPAEAPVVRVSCSALRAPTSATLLASTSPLSSLRTGAR
jgi:formylglycine-generating enzyme required for sulfatase activity